MRRTTLAIALATGALAIPTVALAAGDEDPAPSSTVPVQQQPEQQQPEQQQQRRDRDCPEGQDGGSAPESGGGSDTLL
jgi:hypothetical protein